MINQSWRYDGRHLDVFGTVPVSQRERFPAGTFSILHMLDGERAKVHFFLNKKGVEMWRCEYETLRPLCTYDVLGRIRVIRNAIAVSWQR